MSEVQIGQMDTVIEFEPEVITATPPQYSAASGGGDDVSRLRELLRPIIVDLLEDELSRYMRMRG
jgi:hypothetical protein